MSNREEDKVDDELWWPENWVAKQHCEACGETLEENSTYCKECKSGA